MNRKITFAGDEWDPEDHADGYTEWEEVKSKPVLDYDGFYTDYTMWYNQFEDKYVFTFGDKDIYYPENADWDWECENRSEADEWFDDYVGPGEEDEDIYSSSKINSSASDAKDTCKECVTASTEDKDLRNRLMDAVDTQMISLEEDIIPAIQKYVPEYDREWCAEDTQFNYEEAREAFINSMVDDILLAYYPD